MISSRHSVLRRTSGTARAVEPELGIEGDSHGSAPRRFPGLSPGNGGFLVKPFRELTIFEEHLCRKPGKYEIQTRFPTTTREIVANVSTKMTRSAAERRALSPYQSPMRTSTRAVISRHRQFQEAPSGRRR